VHLHPRPLANAPIVPRHQVSLYHLSELSMLHPTPPLLLETYYHVVLAVLPKHVDITLQPRDFAQMSRVVST
jgi:hypothetical protein